MVDDEKNKASETAGVESSDIASEAEAGEIESSEPPGDDEIALSNGWKPFKEYVSNGGDPKRFISAARFNAKGDFIGKAMELKNKVDHLETTLGALADHNRSMDTAYKKALARREKTAQSELDNALDLGDKGAAKDAMKELDEIKGERSEAAKRTVSPAIPRNSADMETFLERATWFKSPRHADTGDQLATDYASAEYDRLIPSIGVTRTEKQVLEQIERNVFARFPEYSKPGGNSGAKSKPKSAPPVGGEAPGRRGGAEGGAKLKENDLTSVERKIMNTFAATGVMSRDQYLEQIKLQRGL